MSDWNWTRFQRETAAMPPRPLLLNTLKLFDGFTGYAVELGCGSGVDTVHLLNSGWDIYTVDGNADGFENVKAAVSDEKLRHVEFKQAYFEDLLIPDTDLVYSSYSIPFCKRTSFDAFWKNIVKAIRPGGRFAGHLFGEQDGWKNYISGITLNTRSEIDRLFGSVFRSV